MDFNLQLTTASSLSKVATDALLVVLQASGAAHGLDRAVESALEAALEAGDLELKPGQSVLLHRPARIAATRLVFVVSADASPKAVAKAVASGLSLIKGGGSRQATVAWAGDPALTQDHVQLAVMACREVTYSYRLTKPSAPAPSGLSRVTFRVAAGQEAACKVGLKRGVAMGEGVSYARELANRPANHCTPTHLALEARQLAKTWGLKAQVLERKDAEKLGMGAFLAVAQGSEQPPKFLVLEYQGGGAKAAPVVLVGKGITFDTGGISLKPAAEMDEMKFDMGGAASVLGTFRAIAQLKPKINLVGLIPACENMPSGRAVKPGDVVKSMSGQTIEILNTDAEGRLILCDALTYAQRFKPAAVIDIATLTGACVIALGHHRSGMYSTDEALAGELTRSGEQTADLCWRMPLDDEYDEGLKSNFADVANVGGRPGGSITAAMFLKRFASKYPWAHLDIAGTAWKSGAAKGGTGRPVPLLTQFLLNRAG
ncbi:MAG: leucyl aminopeptidase [Betaproteobacteria bacterium]|nr:leucyl aminopeptidase [Betaproteobacteria bacterium]